ncbi:MULTISPECIES: diacylglycerol kinase family protein [unclassified Streptomyces]|jgi:diacylglycerol kinase family enzyme|uniref:diacylglycerol/lipid kinase family protein n=1 Tax=unclassified Streptomyces TaxID=2593676 RepID=UPI000F4FA4A7|nr:MULTISPECIES: diacylglycerol kinase family protein [unclassified Streptomyces]MDH6456023.1 diacylglycerol kinase family enzyme [Streptomyces sp. SAI-119]MDH6502049.1 diacylglycerol kinase family enzyme [Streptomyces sp. SAI-149]
MNDVEPNGFGTAARTPARLALLCLAGVVAAVVAAGQWLPPLLGLVGLGLAGAGMWWALAHRGVARLCGALLAVAAPVGVLVLYVVSGVWPFAVAALGLWVAALACARSALRRLRTPRGVHSRPVPPPRRPVLIMNPLSGGGKVGEYALVERAEALGARVVLLDVDSSPDPAVLARKAVAEGADLLGVAGGDGTQALVAGVAAEHDVPFMVLAAGTRNHFAMDLGLDRDDPASGLDALTHGVEIRVDLGDVAGRPFVNTVSFGTYAEIVQSPEYREAKASTTLDLLPDLLVGSAGAQLTATADGERLEAPHALLVSNNPYAQAGPIGVGRRPRLDGGRLGVIGLRIEGAAQAAELALRGERAGGVTTYASRRVTVEADVDQIPVAVDGEALLLPQPVVCTVRPGALRVRVPRNRPGAPYTAPSVDWRRVVRLALERTPHPAVKNQEQSDA